MVALAVAGVLITDQLILNLDDRGEVRHMRADALRRAGFKVLEAAESSQALRYIGSHHPSLVICGAIPTAVETIKTIKMQHPATLILQTKASAAPTEPHPAHCVCAADFHLIEPVEPAELVGSVRSLLRARDHDAQLLAIEARRDFLQSLVEKLLRQGTIAGVAETSSGMIGRFFNAYRAGLYRVASPDHIEFMHCWTSGYLPVFGGTESMRVLGEKLIGEYRAARTVVVENIASVTSQRPHAYASIGAPVLRRGIWQATMFVHGEEGRRWTEAEITLLEDVAQLTWDTLVRVSDGLGRP